MGLGDWLRKTFCGRKPSSEMVPFYDVDVGRIVQIPASELSPGAVRIQLHPSGEVAWALPEQLTFGDIQHPEFDEEIRDFIRRIQTAFAEHRPISFEQWEDGFRRDANPAQEIALWLHAADVYGAFAASEGDAVRREDIYRCIVTCLTTGPDDVWRVLRPTVLTREEAEQVVHRYFGSTDKQQITNSS